MKVVKSFSTGDEFKLVLRCFLKECDFSPRASRRLLPVQTQAAVDRILSVARFLHPVANPHGASSWRLER